MSDTRLPADDACFVSHLECSGTGERHDPGRLHNTSPGP
jgi:hypothetical protein